MSLDSLLAVSSGSTVFVNSAIVVFGALREISQKQKLSLHVDKFYVICQADRLRRMRGITGEETDTHPQHRSADDLDDGYVEIF